MKKNHLSSLLIIFITIFAFGAFISSTSATTTTTSAMTISQFVELMISLGVVPTERVAAARAMVTTLSTIPAVSTATSSLPYIQVLSPNGGESWDMDVSVAYNITWGSTLAVPVTVSLVPAKGAVCDLTAAPILSKKSNNSLAIKLKTALCYNQTTGSSTPLKDGSYKVRVAYKTGTSTLSQDESNAAFKITPVLIPSLTVTSPNGGESLTRGKTYVAKYSLKNAVVDGGGLIYLKLLDSEGNSVFNSHKVVTSAGTYDLEISNSVTPGAYKIQLNLTTNKRVDLEDVSNNLFWISAAI